MESCLLYFILIHFSIFVLSVFYLCNYICTLGTVVARYIAVFMLEIYLGFPLFLCMLIFFIFNVENWAVIIFFMLGIFQVLLIAFLIFGGRRLNTCTWCLLRTSSPLGKYGELRLSQLDRTM